MKSLAVILAYLRGAGAKRNLRVLLRLLAVLVLMITVFSVLFHVIMAREGREFSWPSSVYWTIVTMSTLGFGDITFESDLGRVFSIFVLATGSVFILILFPFTFIQFVWVPWMEARRTARAPISLPDDTRQHLILTGLGPIEDALVRRARQAGVEYVLLVSDLEEALALHDRGYRVMVGDLDDPATYRAARVDAAALVATTSRDTTNTNVAFTVREISSSVPIVATAASAASVDILELAGCNQVLQLGEMLGRAFARRVLGPDARSHAIGEFGELVIAEAAATSTPFVGRSLADIRLRDRVGVNVVGVWDRGVFRLAGPNTTIQSTTVLVLAASREQLDAYDEAFAVPRPVTAPVVIIGGGRVGRATGDALAEAGIDFRIVEQRPERIRDPERYVEGDAAELAVLQRAGIAESPSAVITTHDDDVNVYLTLYCRRLRPDIQVISRANHDRNISTLHRAGADFVMSYASTGAAALWNVVRSESMLLLAEGLDVFRVPVPPGMTGKTLAQVEVRRLTGCNVVAVVRDGTVETNPDPHRPLPPDADLVLIGDWDSELRFLSGLARRAPSPSRLPIAVDRTTAP